MCADSPKDVRWFSFFDHSQCWDRRWHCESLILALSFWLEGQNPWSVKPVDITDDIRPRFLQLQGCCLECTGGWPKPRQAQVCSTCVCSSLHISGISWLSMNLWTLPSPIQSAFLKALSDFYCPKASLAIGFIFKQKTWGILCHPVFLLLCILWRSLTSYFFFPQWLWGLR